MLVLTTWEGKPVEIPDGIDKHALISRIFKLTASLPFTCFRLKKGKLFAAEVVGCIQIGGIRINILPKTDTLEPSRDRDFLLNILHAAGYLRRSHVGRASVRASIQDPLEVVIFEVVVEISQAMQKGLPNRYDERAHDVTSIRGKLDFTKLSTRLPSEQATAVPVRYAMLSIDNQLSRHIKGIASALFKITQSATNRQMLSNILAQMSGVKDQMFNRSSVNRVPFSKLELHWKRPVEIGELLLQEHFPDPTFSGKNDAISMLFPLQNLFEKTLGTLLVTAAESIGLEVRRRTEPQFLFHEYETGNGVVRLRPDYAFYRNSKIFAIADAKWKRVNETQRAYGVKREDLYQMNAYLSRYEVENTIIFVPKTNWMGSDWRERYCNPKNSDSIYVVGVDIESLVSKIDGVRDEALNRMSENLRAVFQT